MIYCRKCGTPNDDNAFKCVSCGEIVQGVLPANTMIPANMETKHPENYLVYAILVTVLCCLPFGIPAIVYAAQVNAKAAAGDHAGAEIAAKKARMWCWWAFGVGLVAIAFYALIFIAAELT